MEFGSNTTHEEQKETYQGEVEFDTKYSYGSNNGYDTTNYQVREPLSILTICMLSGVIMYVSGFLLGLLLVFLFGQWMSYSRLAFNTKDAQSYGYNVHQMKSYRTGFFITLGVVLFIKVLFFLIGTVTILSSFLL